MIKPEVINTFSKGNVDKYVLSSSENGDYVHPEILKMVSPELQQKYYDSYVLKTGEIGSVIDPKIFEKASQQVRDSYVLNMIDEDGAVRYDFQVLPEMPEMVTKTSPEVQQKHWDAFLKDKGVDSFDGYVDKKNKEIDFIKKQFNSEQFKMIKSEFSIQPEILAKASPEVQKQYKEKMALNESRITKSQLKDMVITEMKKFKIKSRLDEINNKLKDL